jgi:hypothetical protein
MKKQTEKQLCKIIQDARIKLNDVENKRKEKENKRLIGKCFKYRNSIGSDNNWWLYMIVLDSKLRMFSFEKTAMGEWRINKDDVYYNTDRVEITRNEFAGEWLKCQAEIQTYGNLIIST